jgi:hypothetical protein
LVNYINLNVILSIAKSLYGCALYWRICYGAEPPALAGNETNESALAGWAQTYNVTADSYQIEIVFMTNNTYVAASALCRSIHLSEVRGLIYSVR